LKEVAPQNNQLKLFTLEISQDDISLLNFEAPLNINDMLVTKDKSGTSVAQVPVHRFEQP
jgi:hypothetical protein